MVKAAQTVISVEFLYLDLSHCGRCSGTGAVLDAALGAVTPALEALGYDIDVHKIHVRSAQQADDLQLIASPTIRINGNDIQPEAYQSSCAECGDLCSCSQGVDCRVWEWNGERTLAPPIGMVAAHLVDAARPTSCSPARQPSSETALISAQNIERFFAHAGQNRCCATDCCG